jgi:hypothetical protein
MFFLPIVHKSTIQGVDNFSKEIKCGTRILRVIHGRDARATLPT